MSVEGWLAWALNQQYSRSTSPPCGIYLGESKPLIGGEWEAYYLRLHPLAHTAFTGRTGLGKTTAIEVIQVGYLKNHKSFMNPHNHGSGTDRLLGWASDAGIRCIVLGAGEKIVGWNPLHSSSGSLYENARELADVCRRHLWAGSWGTHVEQAVLMVWLALSQVGLTLPDATTFLLNSGFRKAVLQHVTISEVREYWTERYDCLPLSRRTALAESLLTKFMSFSEPIVKYSLAQQYGTVDFDKALSEGQTILNKLHGNSFLLSLLMPTFKNAVYRRPVGAPLYAVFLDEFREALGLEYLDQYLRTFRKFGVPLYLGTQDLDLPPSAKSAIFGNCSVFFCFGTSATDAVFLGREFGGPEGPLIAEILPDLPIGHCIVKVRGEPARLLHVRPVPPCPKEAIERGWANALKVGKSRDEIDAEIEARKKRVVLSQTHSSRVRTKSVRRGEDELPEGYEGF